jgi:hypothetical protein
MSYIYSRYTIKGVLTNLAVSGLISLLKKSPAKSKAAATR